MDDTIMVVDDDVDFVELVRALLRGRFSVEGCTNSHYALARIRQSNPVLAILDLQMPEPNGWDLLRAIRAELAFATLPILVVSAIGTEAELVQETLTHEIGGPIDTLAKPFEIDELLAKVESLLQQRPSAHLAGCLSAPAHSHAG